MTGLPVLLGTATGSGQHGQPFSPILRWMNVAAISLLFWPLGSSEGAITPPVPDDAPGSLGSTSPWRPSSVVGGGIRSRQPAPAVVAVVWSLGLEWWVVEVAAAVGSQLVWEPRASEKGHTQVGRRVVPPRHVAREQGSAAGQVAEARGPMLVRVRALCVPFQSADFCGPMCCRS
jgi:hypothetical protein